MFNTDELSASDWVDRLRITRELTGNEYKRLVKYEDTLNKVLKADEIAKMFNFKEE